MNNKEFWRAWWQKLFTQLISIKVWILTALFVFVSLNWITVVVFCTLVGAVLGIKGAYYIAGVIKGKEQNIVDKI